MTALTLAIRQLAQATFEAAQALAAVERGEHATISASHVNDAVTQIAYANASLGEAKRELILAATPVGPTDLTTPDLVHFYRKGVDVLHVGTGNCWRRMVLEHTRDWGCNPAVWKVESDGTARLLLQRARDPKSGPVESEQDDPKALEGSPDGRRIGADAKESSVNRRTG